MKVINKKNDSIEFESFESIEMIEKMESDALLGVLHGFLMPLLFMALSQSRLGLLYLLIPAAIYATVGASRESKGTFITCALILAAITVASWADAPIG